jgi:hypothetical protein
MDPKESLGLDFWSAGVNSGDLENSVGGASVFLSPSTLIMEQQDYFALDFMRGDDGDVARMCLFCSGKG